MIDKEDLYISPQKYLQKYHKMRKKSFCACLSLCTMIFSCASGFRAQNRKEVVQAPESIKCIIESVEL